MSDRVIKKRQKKVICCLLPTWGDKVDKKWGIGPVILIKKCIRIREMDRKQYKDFQNIIWIMVVTGMVVAKIKLSGMPLLKN